MAQRRRLNAPKRPTAASDWIALLSAIDIDIDRVTSIMPRFEEKETKSTKVPWQRQQNGRR